MVFAYNNCMALPSLKSHYQKIKAFYQRYERFFMPIVIIWGFVYHYITFKIIPIEEVLYLVFSYLALATITILFVHLYDSGKITQKLKYVRLFAPLLLQFSLGSIIGGVFIFYWFSGSIFVSWPFIAIMLIFIIAIEAFRVHLEKPAIQFILYNFATILLLGVALPYFFNSLSPWLFVAAAIISFALVLGLMLLLSLFSEKIKRRRFPILFFSSLISLVMIFFYFFNLIPPVPLSIREAGVYHNISRTNSGYLLQAEPLNFWQKLSFSPTIHLGPGEQAFVYTAIYSPADLNTNIIDDWQHYDQNSSSWVSISKLSFFIVGGRQNGYRGYTLKSNLADGAWQVFVETPRGQVLGHFQFNIEHVAVAPALEQIQK